MTLNWPPRMLETADSGNWLLYWRCSEYPLWRMSWSRIAGGFPSTAFLLNPKFFIALSDSSWSCLSLSCSTLSFSAWAAAAAFSAAFLAFCYSWMIFIFWILSSSSWRFLATSSSACCYLNLACFSASDSTAFGGRLRTGWELSVFVGGFDCFASWAGR